MHTPARVAGVLILAAATLAGCAMATPGPASPATGTPPVTTSATPSAAPATGGPTLGVTLPWPAAGAGTVSALQSAVDGGAQPWLLDPTEVALSYAAAQGWTSAEATADGTRGVTVRSSAGTHALTLAQPGSTGNGGIWVVTSDSSK